MDTHAFYIYSIYVPHKEASFRDIGVETKLKCAKKCKKLQYFYLYMLGERIPQILQEYLQINFSVK
jgi:hypothetical protein